MDFNIENYTIHELEKVISLPMIDYNHIDIQTKCDEAISIVRSDTTELTPKEHIDIIVFFNQIKDKLIQYYFEQQKRIHKHMSPPPVMSIPQQYHKQEKKYVTQLINIDTQFRKQYDNTVSTDFRYELKAPIKNVVSMKLASLEVPNVWKSINKYNNTFRVLWKTVLPTIDVSGDMTTLYERVLATDSDASGSTITIPEGNYNVTNVVKTLKNLFDQKNIPINVVFDENSGKLIFTRYLVSATAAAAGSQPMVGGTYHPDLNFVLLFGRYNETEYLTFGYKMGFRSLEGVYESKKNTYQDTYKKILIQQYDIACIADSVFGAAEDTYIYLCVNDFQHSVINSVITDNFIDNILARIVITSDAYTVILDNNSDQVYKSREYSGPVTLTYFQVQLKDKYGKIIDISNENFNFSIEVKRLL